MEKIDLRKQYASLYPKGKAAEQPHLVKVPPLQYVMADGRGDPNDSVRFQEITAALYSAAYGVKFTSKAHGKDFTVMGLEGLWWSDDPSVFALDKRGEWRWTLMILQPEWITAEMVERALEAAVKRGKVRPTAADEVSLETFEEGESAQILHIGPFAEEGPTIERLHDFIAMKGYRLSGKHHEVYLSDYRRADPEKMKTVIRNPVEPI
jgi:hypothetical protein